MLLLTKLIQTMPAQLATAVNAEKFTHVDKAKLDIKNFTRIKTFTNKHTEWKGWRNQFSYAVAECDASFAKTLTGMEKNEQPINALSDLNPTQAQLSAILFNRLQAVTTSTANTMVMSTEGNGCEAWRLLNKFFDPQTDQRLTKSIMEVINYKSPRKGHPGRHHRLGTASQLTDKGSWYQPRSEAAESPLDEHHAQVDVGQDPRAYRPAPLV